ncbi:MAG: right-handed parallel beta-helix repeat-containing protein, partial [Planctomycetota bacterium]
MRSQLLLILTALAVAGCGGSTGPVGPPIVVNSLEDLAAPPEGTVTLRSGLAAAASGQTVAFDPALDGGVIELSIVGAEHTVLRGEVMGMRQEPSGPVSYLVGYFERDSGRSALYARKDVVIDASQLSSGITFVWNGVAEARVLAVYGRLTMTGVTIRGGRSVAEDIAASNPDQPWTLARGAAVAVWGRARLADCTLYDNHCVGDFDSSRDRGAFGGGIYADIVELDDCIIAGNTVVGGGAAGGGVYSVGGAGTSASTSTIRRCSITGNRISALFTYGGGVYSDGGGIGNQKTLELTNCTIARNVVEPAPGMPSFLLAMGYWRGGGVYLSNGFLRMQGCTVVENEVSCVARTDELGKPNLAGGIAATIGNAHAVEDLDIGHSIVAGNLVHELGPTGVPANTYGHDIFTGSLFYFRST